MSRAKEILDKLNEAEEPQFKEGDFVYFVGGAGDPSYNSFGKVNAVNNDEILIDVICKLDGRAEIDDVADENGQTTRKPYQVFPGKEMLEKKISTTKLKLGRLEELLKTIGE